MNPRQQFILDNYKTAAAVTRNTGIFPETLLAIAIVESSRQVNGVSTPGASLLSSKYNNYFGIKAQPGYTGNKILLTTREVYNGTEKIIKDTFRVYRNKSESFKDFVNFLQVNPRYRNAGVFNSKDYAEQIIKISRAGYATDPNYSAIIKSVADSVEKYAPQINKTLPLLIPFTGLLIGYLWTQKNLQSNL